MAREINPNDNWREKLLKQMPSELIAANLAVNAFIFSAMNPGTAQTALLWVAFVICLAATPMWLYWGQNVKNLLQIIVTSVAFVVWAMTVDGAFTSIPGYQTSIGAVALALFTLVVAPTIGLITQKTSA
jgi:hypothetical protein